jgi:arylsulfatase A-like enzyme
MSTHVACGSLEGVAKNYYAGLVAVDENIGRVLDHLEKKKILDDTAILHSSDHGYFHGEWRLLDKRLMSRRQTSFIAAMASSRAALRIFTGSPTDENSMQI